MPVASYDEIADWYEEHIGTRPDDPLEFGRVLRILLGPGEGTCLEIGCGTGMHAGRIRALGRTPVGAAHWPLPALLDMLTGAGLTPERFAEGGSPTPSLLGIRAVKA